MIVIQAVRLYKALKHVFFSIWTVLFLFPCTEEEPVRTDENLVQNLYVGQWRISSLLINGVNQTSEFEGSSFVFYPSGQFEIFRGKKLLGQGIWSTTAQGIGIQPLLSFPQDDLFAVLHREGFQVHIMLNPLLSAAEGQGWHEGINHPQECRALLPSKSQTFEKKKWA